MDHFYAFLIFAVLIILEQMARAAWLPIYYRLGIPVNLTRMPLAREATPTGKPAAEDLSPVSLEKALQERFKNNPHYSTIRFKSLTSKQAEAKSFQPLEIAFHETPFEARRGLRYLPVMHSRARIDGGRGLVTVIGFIDWYVIFTMVYLALTVLEDRSFIPVAVLVLLVLGLSYFGQSAVNRHVAERLNAILSKKEV